MKTRVRTAGEGRYTLNEFECMVDQLLEVQSFQTLLSREPHGKSPLSYHFRSMPGLSSLSLRSIGSPAHSFKHLDRYSLSSHVKQEQVLLLCFIKPNLDVRVRK